MMGRLGGRSAILIAIVTLAGCASSAADEPILMNGAASRGVTVVAGPLVSNGASEGAYSSEQAQRGRETFTEVCRECHSSSEFRGRDFEFTWRRRSAWEFYRQLRRTMPEDFPGALAPQAYVDVIAYVLEINDYPSGAEELLPNEESLRRVPLGPGANKGGLE